MKHTLKFKESRQNDTQRLYKCENCKLSIWFVAPRIFLDYDHRYDNLITECVERDDCVEYSKITIEKIAQDLYDVLCEREWDRDDWNEINYCINCGASIKGTSLPKHKDECEFVKVTKLFEDWKNSEDRKDNNGN